MKVWLIKKIITSLSCAMALILVAPSAFADGWGKDVWYFWTQGLECELHRYESWPSHIHAVRKTKIPSGKANELFFVYAETKIKDRCSGELRCHVYDKQEIEAEAHAFTQIDLQYGSRFWEDGNNGWATPRIR